MWETYRLPLSGNFSLRKIALMFIAALLSALFVATLGSTTTFADNAAWEGETIKYQNNTYTRMSPAPASLPGIKPENNAFYQYQQGNDISIIAIRDNPDKTKEITDAQIGTFLRDAAGNYTPRAGPTNMTINANAAAAATTTGTGTTSCSVEGVGWIICGPSRWIAGGMDKVYDWLNGFLTVKPLTTDTGSGLYTAWEIARGIANACFIIAFLVIIYSQITTYGISNYEIKKMIPKLIVAAILVNVSYYICAIAVDTSNILGDSVQQALIEIRNTISSAGQSGGANWLSWENITEYILSGGALAVAGKVGVGALLTATGGSATSLIFLLFPILVAGLLSVLVALAILAARQAIITVLIVISPLAFVAFLLPNTEKYFEKWRGLFTTMLLVFPLFSLLFGGSQLASALIIQNADQASVVILALFIQVAPLVITPFLIQFSGSLLGRFAGMVNNPNKGLIDRTRNWSKERADIHAGRARAAGEYSRNPLSPRRAAFKRDMGRRHREDQKKLYDAKGDAAWANDSRAHQLGMQTKYAELRTSTGHAETENTYEREMRRNNVWQHTQGRKRSAEESVKMLQTQQNAAWEEMKSRQMTDDNQYAQFAQNTRVVTEQQRIADGRMQAAQSMQKIEHANDLIRSEALQAAVGGIAGHGAQRALATAVSEYRKDYNDRINEANAILQHYNLSGAERQAHALGQEVVVYDDNRNMKILRKDSLFTREAAIEAQMKTGTYDDIEAIVSRSGGELESFKTTISSAIAENRLSGKAIFLGGKTIDDTSQGKITSLDQLMVAVTSTIAKGKISSTDLTTNDSKALARIYEAARARNTTGLSAEEVASLDASIAALKQSAQSVLSNPTVGRDLKENSRKVLQDIIDNV